MSEDQGATRGNLLSLTAGILGAYLSNNAIASGDIPNQIQTVFETLSRLAMGEEEALVTLTPAVPIKRSVTDNHIVCLEDGKKLKILKRHLMTAYGMTPEHYRAKWGLPYDYPMVAPSYRRMRQELAKTIGLGRKPRIEPPVTKGKPTRTRRKPAA